MRDRETKIQAAGAASIFHKIGVAQIPICSTILMICVNMGAVWALAQPVVTVGMYYIVFDKLMGNAGRGVKGVPFVLFLTAGLVPWFYFNEALRISARTGILVQNNEQPHQYTYG